MTESTVYIADDDGKLLARITLTGPDRDPYDAAFAAVDHLTATDRARVRLIFVRQGEEVTRVR